MTDLVRESAPQGGYRLLVRSIGTADAAVIPALRRLRGGPDVELAGLLYRAPSELLGGLDRETGTKLRDLLRQTGVDVDLTPESETFERGTGDFEVALVVRQFDQVVAIFEETMRVLGVDVDAARKIVCAVPAVMLGAVSEATVEALRSRFAPLGVEVDASRTKCARFDIAVETGDDMTRKLLTNVLAEVGSAATWSDRGQLLATGFDAPTATRIWEQLSRTTAKIRILNRDLQRFDVRLESAPNSDEVKQWLIAVTGMPARVANIALTRMPFMLAENVSSATTVELLGQAHALGARASGILLALQRFALVVKPGGDRAAVRPWVEAIAGKADAESFARGGTTKLAGPFTKTQARWLQHELRRGGVASQLSER
jgi:hypothetical protein